MDLFKINKITYDNNKINNQIARSLKSVSNNEATRILNFDLSSKKEKIVVSKNRAGDPEIFEITFTIDINNNNKNSNDKNSDNNKDMLT